jgi:oligoribonuclease
MLNTQAWVWMDLEMTGLDDKSCTIIQIATIITDQYLRELDCLDIVVWQPESVLSTMSPFVRNMHTENGLLQRVRQSPYDMIEAERKTLDMIAQHVPFKKGILAGNSIWQDRRFLLRYMPHIENYLHYRMIDVSSLKTIVQSWYPPEAQQPHRHAAHTALEDIRQSIEELQFYRRNIFIDPT